MTDYRPFEETDDRLLPTSVRTVRVLLYVGAAITALTTLGFLMFQGVSAQSIGQAVWIAWPGVAAFFLARRVPDASRRTYWLIVAVAAFWILAALAGVGRGDPRGVTELILPIAVLVALTRATSREFFGPQAQEGTEIGARRVPR